MKKLQKLLFYITLVLVPSAIAGQETLFPYSYAYPPFESFVDQFSDHYTQLTREYMYAGDLGGMESCVEVQSELNIFQNLIFQGSIENQRGAIEYYKNNSNSALQYYLRALDYFDRAGNSDGINLIMNNIAAIFTHIEDYESSRKYLVKALEFTPEDDINSRSIYMLNLADAESKLKNCSIGIRIATDLLEIYDPEQVLFSELYIYGVLISCYNNLGMTDEAFKWIEQGTGSIDANTTYLDRISFYFEAIRHHFIQEDYEEVLELGLNIYPLPDTAFTRDMYESINYMAIAALNVGEIDLAQELDKLANKLEYGKETLNREELITPLMVEYSSYRDIANRDLSWVQLSENNKKDKAQRKLIGSLVILILGMIVAVSLLSRSRRLRNKFRHELSEKNDKLEKINSHLKLGNEELEKGNSLLDTLISVFAHDLINPFQAILGFSQLMSSDHDAMKDEDLIEYSGLLADSTFQLNQLLTNLRSLSLTQGDPSKLESSKVEPLKIIQDVVKLFEASARKKNIRFNIKEKESKFYGHINSDILESVVRNVVSNAVKFSYSNSSIDISCTSRESDIDISIIDHGVGMHQHVKLKLEDNKYPQSRPGTENEKGSGIGLAISSELLESFRGSINISKNKEGKGTEVIIRIPIWHE